MTSSTGFRAGDVVRVSFIFTSQTGAKVRPAVVISSGAFHASRADVIMMPLSTQTAGYFGDRPLLDWQAAGLPRASHIKAVVQTIARSAISGRFGKLTMRDIQQVKDTIAAVIELP